LDDLRPDNRFDIHLAPAQYGCFFCFKVADTAVRQLGLDHYEDLKTRIPRPEAEAIYAIIKRVGGPPLKGSQSAVKYKQASKSILLRASS
jgi:hypothetical protein